MLAKLKRPPKRGNKGKKNRAHGRNKIKCARYRSEHRREKSHIRRLTKHLRRHVNDTCAVVAIERFRVLLVK